MIVLDAKAMAAARSSVHGGRQIRSYADGRYDADQAFLNMQQTTASRKPVVFVVDDDVSIRESLEHLILAAGWEPMIFDSARQFLERPDVMAPSCLILDVNMPGVNGLDLQRQMATDGSLLPIIFVTGSDDVPINIRAIKAGAVEFLTKPIDTHALLKAVRAALASNDAALRS